MKTGLGKALKVLHKMDTSKVLSKQIEYIGSKLFLPIFVEMYN